MSYLENDDIILRALEPADLDTIFKWENDTSIWAIGCTMAPLSKMQICEYIKDYTGDIYSQHQLRFLIERKTDKQRLGLIDVFDFDPFHKRAYLGLLIDQSQRRKNYGYSATCLLIDYAKNFLGIHQLVANIPADNTPCLNLFKQLLDFKQTGILKDWIRIGNDYHDVVVLQLILD